MNIACRSAQNAARIKRFLRLHIVIKLFNKNNIHNKFFIVLKRNSINVHSNTRNTRTANLALIKSENRLAEKMFLEILERFR